RLHAPGDQRDVRGDGYGRHGHAARDTNDRGGGGFPDRVVEGARTAEGNRVDWACKARSARWVGSGLALRQLLAERWCRSRQRLVLFSGARELGRKILRAAAIFGQRLHAPGHQRDVHGCAGHVTLSTTPTSVVAGASVIATWSGIGTPTATD